ncbi:MAG: tRNA lysidine(34) synthetase TilS [Clostridia bacterium]|nr:tRNA lysidine(34) synthetase TilS [Clostridia bacterium]
MLRIGEKMIDFTITKTIEKFNMLHQNSCVVVGVSGGADSMCLLHYLCSVKEKFNLDITVAHVNHGIRGDEAFRDQNLVEQFCNDNDLKFALKSINVPKLSREMHIGEEECGRIMRYSFFQELAHDGLIATAHTASDNAETVLFNMTRGAGLNGIGGIKPVRGNIIRPLIMMTRADVEHYCKSHNVKYFDDSTNFSDDYTRNKIRHSIMPTLGEINSSAVTNISLLSESAREDDEYLNSIALKELADCALENGYSCDKINILAQSIKKRAIIIMASDMGISLSRKHINLILEMIAIDGAVDVDSNYRFISRNGVCCFCQKKTEDELELDDNSEFKITDFSSVVLKGQKFTFLNFKDGDIEQKSNNFKKIFNNSINCDIINDNTLIRGRLPGDYFKKAGTGCTKPLKKLLNELKYTTEQRKNLVLIANGSEVLWIDGIGVSEKAKINDRNHCILIIKTEEQ